MVEVGGLAQWHFLAHPTSKCHFETLAVMCTRASGKLGLCPDRASALAPGGAVVAKMLSGPKLITSTIIATSCRTAPGHVMVALRWLQLLNEKASKLWTVVADAMRPSELEEFD
ncbi:hypothetical protein [Tardiphaga sp. OK245]|uniref:hypothetical protein n=1 Tax=Tardiphaga sp. OK245 TaxID=1855306 RepID=UPI0008A7B4B1|nr:hypothetical protein [Tardiphaga sp. OK245]SEH87771.1 hypothetical protein SAMN05216367_2494 [Tardiphaga sp. OK245]